MSMDYIDSSNLAHPLLFLKVEATLFKKEEKI
jgi:hypothetical protein